MNDGCLDDEQDAYVTQLREVFDSCDGTGNGYLNKEELYDLCDKLQLHEQTGFFVKRLLQDGTDGKVDFCDFKECFVSLLTQSINTATSEYVVETDLNNQKLASDREVSPKFVLGQKKYGRRSRPESSAADTDNDAQSDFSEGDILTVSYTQDNDINIELSDSVFQSRIEQNIVTPTSTPSRSKLLEKSAMKDASNKSASSSHFLKCEAFDMEEPDSVADSDISSTYHGDNEEQYLRGIWRKLGVGKGGYLDLLELTIVCQHIGMDMTSDEVVKQLFEKLDSDQDGKVSFEEFLQGLFQHGFSPGSPENSVFSESGSHSENLKKFVMENEDERKGSVSGVIASYCGVFSVIDPDNKGLADATTLCELWDSLGLTSGLQLLNDLGFKTKSKINLQDLTDILEEELQSNRHTEVYQYAVATYLHEMQYIKSNYEQVKGERDKLHLDLTEANSRSAILAQEVDDHHAKLEQSSQNKIMFLDKKYQDQIKGLQIELEREREQVAARESRLRQQMYTEIETVREGDVKLKEELAYFTKENARLEQELADLLQKHDDINRLNSLHQKELDSLSELRQKMVDMESGKDYLNDQHYQNLMDEMENGREEIQELKDRNDELGMEVESLRQKLASCERPMKRHKRNGSWLADYTKVSPTSSLKRRESGSSTEDGMGNSDDDSPIGGKVRRKVLLAPINQERASIEIDTLKENHKLEIDRLSREFEQAIADLTDSHEVQLIKLNSQLNQAMLNSDNKVAAELASVKQQLERQIKMAQDEAQRHGMIVDKLRQEVECHERINEEIERNHLSDKNELLTRLENECQEKIEQAQVEWYQRLEALRQESGDELDAGNEADSKRKRQDRRMSGSELLKQLEEQKLLMMRKYKNLKSQLRVTTEELEMALAREKQAEEMHVHLQKRCLKVEERLIQMASGVDSGSETSTELVAATDEQAKNRPQEVIITENTQLKRRNALLLNRCEVLERSLHAAKAREYFSQSYPTSESKTEGKTDEELQEIELKRKIENLESKLQLSQQEIQMSKLEVEKYWKDVVADEKKQSQILLQQYKNNTDELKTNVDQLKVENETLKKLYESKIEDLFVGGVNSLSGKLREDFDRLVNVHVHETWQQIVMGGEKALSGKLKEDFNALLSKAAHKIEQTLRNQFNEDKENKIRSCLSREKRMLKAEYEDRFTTDFNDEEPSRTDILLKDLFVENAQLVKALQITEERQMKAEKSNLRLQKKCRMLSKVLSDVARVAVD